jgi:hypothetical protein
MIIVNSRFTIVATKDFEIEPDKRYMRIWTSYDYDISSLNK